MTMEKRNIIETSRTPGLSKSAAVDDDSDIKTAVAMFDDNGAPTPQAPEPTEDNKDDR